MIPFSDSDALHRSRPVVNIALIGINAVVFLYLLWLGGSGYLWGGGGLDVTVFFFKWGFIPEELTSGRSFEVLSTFFGSQDIKSAVPTWATIFSSMFIHGGLFHFAGNMAFLWVFGQNIEDRLGHLGYLLFYLGTGVAATLSHLAIDPSSQAPLVGASGAIAGVMGAYLMLYPFNRIKALVIFFFITVMELSALIFLGIWFFLQLLNSLGALGLSSGANVAFMAHIGGFVTGVIVISLYKLLTGERVWPSRRRRNPWDYWYRTGRGPD